MQDAGIIPAKGKRLQNFKRWHIRTFLDSVDDTLKEFGIIPPTAMMGKVGAGAAALFTKMYSIAIRDNSENPRVFCTKCRQWHTVEITAHCPVHPEEELPVRVDNIKAEQNSMSVAMKIFDKFMPTLSSVNAQINVQGTITTVSAHLTQIIFKFVPPADRRRCFEEIDGLLRSIQAEDGNQSG